MSRNLRQILYILVPVNCEVGSWNDWTPPNGVGYSSRERYIVQVALNGGADCPVRMQSKPGM